MTKLYASQLWRLTVSEWKLREQSTLLGFLWTLLQPLLMFGVLYALFTKWLGSSTPNYPSYLLIGIVEYNFFNAATTYGLSSLKRRKGILMNFKVRRELVVFSAAGSVAISFLMEFALMVPFIVALGARPSAAWLAVPVLLAAEITLVVGLLLFLSVLTARYHDVERIWSILMTAGFFLTPIFYRLDSISPGRQSALWLNPMTHLIELSRGCLLRGRFPAPGHLAALLGLFAFAAAAGLAFFRAQELKLADYVAV